MKRFVFSAISLFLSFSLRAQDLSPASRYLGAETLARLSRGDEVRASSTDGSVRLSLAPDHPAAARARASMAGEKPGVVVEALFFLRRSGLPARNREPSAGLLADYNVLRSISSLAGLRYYSVTYGKMRTFYESSTLVVGPSDRTPVPDRVLDRLPESERLHALQKDTSFGENLYRIDYATGEGFILMETANETPLRMGILPAAGREAVRVRVLVIETAEGTLFYVVSSASVAGIPGMKSRLEASFGNRAEALYGWFARMSGNGAK